MVGARVYRTESAGGCVQPWCASAVGKCGLKQSALLQGPRQRPW